MKHQEDEELKRPRPQGYTIDKALWQAILAGKDAKTCISEWAFREPSQHALLTLAGWDPRLAVWCAAACAERALPFVPEGEERPKQAIEAARACVRGEISVSAAFDASEDAFSAADQAGADGKTEASAAAACMASAAAAYAATGPRKIAIYARAAVNAKKAGVEEAHLRQAIAKAIETFPRERNRP